MYIHLGEEVLIRSNEIVAILDRETAKTSVELKQYLEKQENNIVNLSKNHFKSIVVTTKNIYLSPLASHTLKKRSMQYQEDY